MLSILFGLFGLTMLVGIAWLFSAQRNAVDWRLVATGIGLQLVFAVLVLLTPWGATAFDLLSRGFVALLGFTAQGSQFIFGDFARSEKFGFVFAFQVLPTIIFFAAFMSVMYHIGVMQWIVKGMAWVITKVMNVSGAETLSVCANAFIGQTEAPLVVKPYILRMTQSELLALMVGGMATIAGGVLGAYVQMLGGADVEQQLFFAKHLMAASIMAAPATLVIAKILYPEREEPLTRGEVRMEVEKTTANVIDAAASGAAEGLKLALNVGAMLLAFIALIALVNAPLTWLGNFDSAGMDGWKRVLAGIAFALIAIWLAFSGYQSRDGESGRRNWARSIGLLVAAFALIVFASTFFRPGTTLNGTLDAVFGAGVVSVQLQSILGFVLSPIAWLIGVPWGDAMAVGGLIGEKIVLNEFVAYAHLSEIKQTLSPQAALIATYALCGFANFSSIAIQIGGIGGIAPERRADLARFGLKAVLGGSLATFMTATIAGVLSQFAASAAG